MIKSISFLISDDERKHIPCVHGRFHVTHHGRNTRSTRAFSAQDFVKFVEDKDPYITLQNGEKLRVYRGGDAKDEVIETISIVETHDNKMKNRTAISIIPDYSEYFEGDE